MMKTTTLQAFHRHIDKETVMKMLITMIISMAIIQLTDAGKAPRIQRGPKVLQKQPGQFAYFACEVEGDPAPWITWERDGKPIRKFGSRFSVNKDSMALRIFRLELGDDGNYTCTAKNAHGVDSVTTSLVVWFKPEAMITTPENYVVLERTNREIVCRARGLPKPSFEWFTNQEKNIRLIDGEDKKATTFSRMHIKERQVDEEMSQSVLVISPVLDEDLGRFTCIASNPVGTDRSSMWLDVRFPPKIVSKHTSPKVVYWWPNHRTNMTCAVIGNDPPTISWKKDGVPLINHTSIVHEVDGSEVTSTFWLDGDTPDAVGTYTCVADNNLGSKEIHYFTVVRAKAPTKVDILKITVEPDEIHLSVRVPTDEDTPPATHIIASYKLKDKDRMVVRRADVNAQREAFVKLPGIHIKKEYQVTVKAVNMVGLGEENTMVVFTKLSSEQPKISSTSSPSGIKETEEEIDYYIIPDDSADVEDQKEDSYLYVVDDPVHNDTVTAYGVRGGDGGEGNTAASFHMSSLGLLYCFYMQIITLFVFYRCVIT